MRLPDIPSGWPRAMAPPFGLTLGSSTAMSSPRRTASAWDAKASFSSMASSRSTPMPRRSVSLRVAGTGPMPMMRGATPALAMPRIRARGVRPWRRTAASLATIIAAAPSLTPEAFPAVTRLHFRSEP